MKFTLSWLKQHLRTEASVEEIGVALTRLGLEVEGIADPAAKLAGFTIARVLTARPHPQADKLQVLEVDAGTGQPLQVVCGAPNAHAGLVGVFGASGTYVPGSGITLKVAAIRGVESNGMMCSMRELELSDEHQGIIELADDAPVGTPFVDHAGLADPVFDIAITPNRQDCMGVRGVARDLAAAGVGTLLPLQVPAVRSDGSAHVAIAIEDAEGCPAFFGRVVSGVTNGASPEWMQRRLAAIGQRSISALVDITNYMMIDLGRPLHVYDMAKLRGGLVARKAREGETIAALNGRSYTLQPHMTVIADEAQVHDVGGIMGGLDSAVSADTRDVLIECAYFTPEGIARTGQALGLTSDARQRFERGVDPAFLHDGLAIATRLVLDLCGGTARDAIEAGQPPVEHRTFRYDPAATTRIAGLAVAPERQRAILHDLGFGVDGAWTVRVPSWRRDIDGIADIVEEVVRVDGIDHVPAVPLPRPAGVARPTATPAQRTERLLRRTAAARGLDEAVTWSFLAAREAEAFGGAAWTLANPISEELKVMRPSLLPGLLAATRRNLARAPGPVQLFEIGRRYLAEGERPTLAFVLAGAAARDWRPGGGQAPDPYAAKAEALALLAAVGAPADRLQTMEPSGPQWHPGRAGTLRLGPKTVLAAFGALHPATLKAFDLDVPLVAGEIYLDAIPARRDPGRMRSAFAPPSLQAVTRDFAFVVPAAMAADGLLRAVRGADKAAIAEVSVFDVFPMGEEKSLALAVTLQPAAKSFAEADLQAISDRIVSAAAKVGARLRG